MDSNSRSLCIRGEYYSLHDVRALTEALRSAMIRLGLTHRPVPGRYGLHNALNTEERSLLQAVMASSDDLLNDFGARSCESVARVVVLAAHEADVEAAPTVAFVLAERYIDGEWLVVADLGLCALTGLGPARAPSMTGELPFHVLPVIRKSAAPDIALVQLNDIHEELRLAPVVLQLPRAFLRGVPIVFQPRPDVRVTYHFEHTGLEEIRQAYRRVTPDERIQQWSHRLAKAVGAGSNS